MLYLSGKPQLVLSLILFGQSYILLPSNNRQNVVKVWLVENYTCLWEFPDVAEFSSLSNWAVLLSICMIKDPPTVTITRELSSLPNLPKAIADTTSFILKKMFDLEMSPQIAAENTACTAPIQIVYCNIIVNKASSLTRRER